MLKIAFLFLVYDAVFLEELWIPFFREAHPESYSIYIHQKNRKPLREFWMRQHVLNETVQTCWGCLNLVEAHNLLLEKAMLDERNARFLLLCGVSAPLKPFSEVYSRFRNAGNTSYYFYFEQGIARALPAVYFTGMRNIKKTSQWSALSRKHARLLLANTEYLSWFRSVNAADEHAHVSYLHHLGLAREIQNDTFFMHTDWSGGGYHPKSYDCKDQGKELHALRHGPFLFGRKFVRKRCIRYLRVTHRPSRTRIRSSAASVLSDLHDQLSENAYYVPFEAASTFQRTSPKRRSLSKK